MSTPHSDLRDLKDQQQYDFTTEIHYAHQSRRGIGEDVVRSISALKNEPQWMLDFRLKALDIFNRMPMPTWGVDLGPLDFEQFYYFMRATPENVRTWDDVPDAIKDTFEKLGIPEAERKFLAGVETQMDSESVYSSLKAEWESHGIIFLDMDTAVQKYPDLVQKYISTIVPIADNKFAALNSAFWSGGSFVYVPPGVDVEIPLQAYFRINAQSLGQFERTIIIAEPGSNVHYIEGCTAPQYTTAALHTGVIEIFVGKGARARYTTIQNWSTNVYNLVTQRAMVEEEGSMSWVDGNLGCLAEGMTVTTPSGVRLIETLEVGDEVLSFDETSGQLVFRKVLAKRFSGYQPVREVAHGERRLRVTDNHPFYSYIYTPERPRKLGRYQLAYVRADQLRQAIVPRRSVDFGSPYPLKTPEVETTFISCNQHTDAFEVTRERASRLTLSKYSTVDLMWLFGLFLGDGNIYRQPAQNGGTRYAKVGFSIPCNNRARAKLIRCMAEIIDTPPTERKDGVQLTWNSVELADLFGLQGLEGTADTKRIPEWVFSTPESHRLAILAGYIDADGTVLLSKRRILIKSVNRQLLQDVARLAVTLGITPRIYTEFAEERQVVVVGYTTTAHGSHRIELPVDTRLLDYVCEGTREKLLSVPVSTFVYHRHIGRSNIELPEPVEVVDVTVGEPLAEAVPTWDIEVEGTGNFIAEGFIVHNSGITMKYPAVVLKGAHAHGEVLSIAFAGNNQHFDAGAKAIHLAPHTSSLITSKSISKGNGRADYRGLVRVAKGAVGAHSKVTCDALLLDPESRTDTYPYMDVNEDDSHIEHEATVSKISEDQLFYLMSRGLTEKRAAAMIVSGFLEPFVKELPMEYAVELNRLIDLQMEGSVG
jgi:Fe-S cluster assembly scaffold protein SufB